MRDLERIDRICDDLKTLWKLQPDQRFGQILENHVFGCMTCIFFKEDDVTELQLKRALEGQ
jgi:hypothetical protein